MRAVLALLAALAAAGNAAAEPIEILATPIPLHPEAPETRRLGPLTYVGGVELNARDGRFGGWSGLLVSADGTRLTAVSDQGSRLDAALRHDESGAVTGLRDAEISALAAPGGGILQGKRDADAEGLARLPGGGLAVSFERNHRLLAYENGTARTLPRPPGIEKAPANGGLEALATLADGRLVAIREAQSDGAWPAWIETNSGWRRFEIEAIERFSATGADALPDGDLLLIARHFTPLRGPRIVIARIGARDMAPGARVRPRELARLQLPMNVDNFEGVAVRPGPGGSALIYLISDDNFNKVMQRTLLMLFRLDP